MKFRKYGVYLWSWVIACSFISFIIGIMALAGYADMLGYAAILIFAALIPLLPCFSNTVTVDQNGVRCFSGKKPDWQYDWDSIALIQIAMSSHRTSGRFMIMVQDPERGAGTIKYSGHWIPMSIAAHDAFKKYCPDKLSKNISRGGVF